MNKTRSSDTRSLDARAIDAGKVSEMDDEQTPSPVPTSPVPSSIVPSSTVPVPMKPIPVVPGSLTRKLAIAVPAVVIGSAFLLAVCLQFSGHPEWWAGYWPATVIAVLGGIVSIVLLSRAAGQPVDAAISVVLMAAGARIAISVIGVIVAVQTLQKPLISTTMLACVYYVVTLIVESVMLSNAARDAIAPPAT